MLLLMAAMAYLILNFGGALGSSGGSGTHSPDPSQPSKPGDEARILDNMQDHRLIYTKHAKCRMNCRTISKAEVNDILDEGHINWRKSKPDDLRGCPTYAVEGETDDGQEVRIVFAACDDVTKVITTIDLDNEYKCHCP